MRLIQVRHMRCDEWSADTLVLAPEDWDDGRVQEAVRAAQVAYIEALADTIVRGKAPNDYREYLKPPFEAHPDRTVAEVMAEWEAKRVVWVEWHERQRGTRRRMEDFLTDEGFLPLWGNADLTVELDWGHRHGQRIDYGGTLRDGWPTPERLAMAAAYDESEW